MQFVTIATGDASKYWTRGLKISGAHNLNLDNCSFDGGPTPGGSSNYAIEIAKISVNCKISNVTFTNWEYGIYCATYQEGLSITNSDMVYVFYGIYIYQPGQVSVGSFVIDQLYYIKTLGTTTNAQWNTIAGTLTATYSVGSLFTCKDIGTGLGNGTAIPLRGTGLYMTNTHIDARGTGSVALWIENFSAVYISSCLFIAGNNAASGDVIRLYRVFESAFDCNQIYGPSLNGIHLGSQTDGEGCVANVISNNVFRGQATSVRIDSGSTNTRVVDNVANEANTGTTVYYLTYVDNGTDNTFDGSISPLSKTTSYTLEAKDNGKYISITTGGITVPSGVFYAGNVISVYNNSGSSQTITQGASTTLRLAGGSSTGNRTLDQYGLCTILCVGSNTFVIVGQGLS